MKTGRPFIVWIATISLSLVLVFQAATLAAGIILPHWRVQPIQILLMFPTASGLLALAFPRERSLWVASLALGVLLAWFVSSAVAFGVRNGPLNLEFIWAFVAIWAWIFCAFAFGKATRVFFAGLRNGSEGV